MKQPLPKVSIGLIVYNGAATLRVALDSILNQTFTDFGNVRYAHVDDQGGIGVGHTFPVKAETS